MLNCISDNFAQFSKFITSSDRWSAKKHLCNFVRIYRMNNDLRCDTFRIIQILILYSLASTRQTKEKQGLQNLQTFQVSMFKKS